MMPNDRTKMARIFWSGTAIHAALALVFTGLLLIDSRQILGVNAWIKPLKFAITGFIYLGTLALFARVLPASLAPGKGIRHAWIIALMILGETLFIAMQSARGVASHFNQATLFDGIVYSAMGVMIIANTVSFTLITRHFFKGEQVITGPLLTGIRWGVALFLVGSFVGGVMSGLNRHTVGIPDGGPGLPLINFSTVAGDLRIAHFLGLHALQVLPFIGLCVARWHRHAGFATKGFLATAVAYACVFVAVLAQALVGHPLFAL